MREIKFKAWDKSAKKWHTRVQVGTNCYHSIYDEERGDWFEFDQFCGEVVQYTGLKDKNGVEIYEGDIVRNRGYSELCIVEWYQGQNIGRYRPQTPHYPLDESKTITERGDLSYVGLGFYAIERNALEVIGNIYEHPHLLEDHNANNY